MSRRTKLSALILALGLFAATSVAFAFPFWLSAPSRGNVNDPKSPDFHSGPTNTPVTPPYTSTPITPSVTTTPPTPTVTPTNGPGPLLADFENNDPVLNGGGAEDNWNEPIIVGCDIDGTTESPPSPPTTSPLWGGGSQSAGNGPSAGGGYSGCISGNILMQVNANPGVTPVYPFAFMAMDVTPNGNTGASGDVADIGPYVTNNGIQFDYMGTTTVAYVVQIMAPTSDSTCGNFYQFQFTPPNTGWNTMDVYFPGVVTSGNVFAQPNYACTPGTTAWSTDIGAVQFKVVASTSSAQNYNLCVDNVSFNPPPAPTPPPLDVTGAAGSQTITNGTIISTFEYANNAPAANDQCDGGNGPFASPGQIFWGDGPTGDSTVVNAQPNNSTWASNSFVADNGPTIEGTSCMEFAGTLAAASTGAYAVVEVGLTVPGPDGVYGTATLGDPGYNAGQAPAPAYAGNIDTIAIAPHQRFVFDYRNGPNGEGTEMEVQLCTQNAPNYEFDFYTFTTAMDTNWHNVIIYFPDSANGPRFAPFPGTSTAWDPTQVEMIEIGPVNPPSGESYDYYLDNLWFD